MSSHLLQRAEDALLVYDEVDDEPSLFRFHELVLDNTGCPLVIPGNQLEISLQDGALAFRMHSDFEETQLANTRLRKKKRKMHLLRTVMY